MENSSTPSVMVWSALRVLLVALIFIAPVFVPSVLLSAPLSKTILPPVTDLPADNLILPPVLELPSPTDTIILPPIPLVDLPVDSTIPPLMLLLVPDVIETEPLFVPSPARRV